METKEKTRYSDSELKEFKLLLLSKLTTAREELGQLLSSLDSTNSSSEKQSDGTNSAEKEEITYLAGRQKKFIASLDAALMRIENKTYGICTKTERLIPAGRLRAVPHTTQCLEAKEGRRAAA